MSKRIEDYGLIGDRRSAALVARDGSIDWLCWPHFDSDACFAALLGDERHGRWRLAPREQAVRTTRRYRPDTLILETRHETANGAVTVTDFMPIDAAQRAILRRVKGESGTVELEFALRLRFDYGRRVPWRCVMGSKALAVTGPDLIVLHSDIELRDDMDDVAARFTVDKGDVFDFTLQYALSHQDEPKRLDLDASLRATERYWVDWIGRFDKPTEWTAPVKRSLITLQALVDADSGGILGAPTLGLPEIPQGSANWDYRYSWLRDSAFTLSAYLHSGFIEEARVWRDWLLRAIAGSPAEMRTMYRVTGAIHIESRDIRWLPGYENAQPVRVGNAAATQRQLDIYGEVLNSLYLVHHFGIDEGLCWDQRAAEGIVEHVEKIWRWPDQGIWESRDAPKDFTHSKAMTWVAVDRFLKLSGAAVDKGRRQELEGLRDAIHADVCGRAFDPERNSFLRDYNSQHPDASLLRLPLIGFLPPDDPRMRGTIAAIEHELIEDGLVRRWPRRQDRPDEGAFLACTCWLADCLTMQGREAEARAYFERFLATRNDLGLLSEEWDTREHRLMGNFPQAISHVALINTALRLSGVIPKREPTDKATTR